MIRIEYRGRKIECSEMGDAVVMLKAIEDSEKDKGRPLPEKAGACTHGQSPEN